jgi:hypothetical protein
MSKLNGAGELADEDARKDSEDGEGADEDARKDSEDGEGADEDARKDSEDGEGEDEDEAERVKGLPKEAQAAVNERIGKLVRERNTAREELETAKGRLTELERTNDATLVEAARRAGVLTKGLGAEDAKVLEHESKLKGWLNWLEDHEGSDYEGKGGDDPSMSADEIRRTLRKVSRDLMEVGPRAARIRERSEEEFLRVYRAGEAALARKADPKKGKPGAERAPIAPGHSGGSGSGRPAGKSGGKGALGGMEEYRKAGGGIAGLEAMYRKTLGG